MQASRAASVVSVGIAGYSVFGYKSSHVKSPAPVPSRIAEIFWSNESAISGFALVKALHRLTEAFSSEVEFVSSANLWGISCSTLMKLVCTTPFHPCLSEAVDLRGAARKLLFVHGVRFAALLRIGGGSVSSWCFIQIHSPNFLQVILDLHQQEVDSINR